VLLYHYCSVSSMMSIIENKYLRMTNALNTNDKTEFRYFKNKLVEYAKTTRTDSEKIKNTVEEIIKFAEKEDKDSSYIPYICCFSEAQDLLSQWRGYGDDGFGVALGFDFSENNLLLPTNYTAVANIPFISKVTYIDEEELPERKVMYQIEKSFYNLFTEFFFSTNQKGTVGLGSIQVALSSIKMKNSGFSEEQEHRIVLLEDKNQKKFLEEDGRKFSYEERNIYCPGGRTVTTCYEYRIKPQTELKEIILGPKCKIEQSSMEWKDFLAKNDLQNVKVKKSRIPYC